jgi:2,3-bisphosphoglycerate-independent phosphoglycerate mutase
MDRADKILKDHEINVRRKEAGENPANSVWLWGQGIRPDMPLFKDVYGISGAIISAVPLLRSLSQYLGLELIGVEGITGYLDTNYKGKGLGALRALQKHDLVCVHVEAPDEAGHSGDTKSKKEAIERIDEEVLGTILDDLDNYAEWRVLVLADHPTPIVKRTHTAEPVPFVLCGTGIDSCGAEVMGESSASASGIFIDKGYRMMEILLGI